MIDIQYVYANNSQKQKWGSTGN